MVSIGQKDRSVNETSRDFYDLISDEDDRTHRRTADYETAMEQAGNK